MCEVVELYYTIKSDCQVTSFFLSIHGKLKDMPAEIDADGMEDIKNSDETWVIDFWADWCQPCKKLAPVFEEVSEEVDANFGKVDMEAHQQIGTSMGVRALPTLIIMKNGEEVDRRAGALPKNELKSWIESNL